MLLCTRPYPNIIFMSGAHGVAGWVWGGDGWVFVDRRLFHVVASGYLALELSCLATLWVPVREFYMMKFTSC